MAFSFITFILKVTVFFLAICTSIGNIFHFLENKLAVLGRPPMTIPKANYALLPENNVGQVWLTASLLIMNGSSISRNPK